MSFAAMVRSYVLRVSPDRPGSGGAATTEADAGAVLRAVIFALADVLPQQLADALLALVPGVARVAERTVADDDPGRFASRVAEHLGLPLPAALERAEVALAVLGSGLEPGLRARVSRELPDALRVHFEGVAVPDTPTHSSHGRGHTLADGRPGP